jgi:hypothetical protein
MKSVLRVGDLVIVCGDFVPSFPESPLMGKVGVIVSTLDPAFSTRRHSVLVDGSLSVFLEYELMSASREDSSGH